MKHINGNTQMTDVWRLPAIAPWEKTCTKHPTQKPLGLLSRIILASTQAGAWVLDPFAGSSTTGIAANLLGRRFLGIEREEEFVAISKARRDKRSRHIWLDGYYAMLSILNPSHILRYGGMIEGERCDISTFYTNNNKIG